MVQDVNDHAPMFENGGSYTGHVMEGQAANTEVVVVKASDIDEGTNAQIMYVAIFEIFILVPLKLYCKDLRIYVLFN